MKKLVPGICTKQNAALLGASFWYFQYKHSQPVKPHDFGDMHRCKFLVQVS